MTIEHDFYQAIEEWIGHCKSTRVQLDSSMSSIRECEAYRTIVSMGRQALPLIRTVYDRDATDNFELSIIQGHGLILAVEDIAGDDFIIPTDIQGRVPAMQDYTKRWLDETPI